jgi:hypothetical protein
MGASSKTGTARSKELPHSDIRATAARVIGVSKIQSSAWSHGGEYVVEPSIVVEFTNQAKKSGPETEPTVSALLTYQDAKREILQIPGGWTDSPTAVAQFKIGESHTLLLGSVQDGHFVAVEVVPAAADGGHGDHLQIRHALPDFHHGLVCVSLTDVRNQRLLYDSYFEIGVNPLRISQNIPRRP